MTYREATRKLRELGCHELARRAVARTKNGFNPKTQRVTTLPDWGHKDLKQGTIRAAVKQLGIDWPDFEAS